MADVIRIDNDEGYTRLARWEQHLDDRIASGMRDGSLDPERAWRLQKNLDSIEAHVLQSYYESDNGIDFQAFRTYAGQLRQIGSQLGDEGWGSRNVYGDGWRDERDAGPDTYGPPSRPYYREGDYERDCRAGNAAAGTIFGALAGGLIGGAASHGNGGAVVGGVILGGLLGNALTRDIDCEDQRYAFDAYRSSLNGEIGRDYDWHHGDSRGTFTSVRAYEDHGMECRAFHAVIYRHGEREERDGAACRRPDGDWDTR